MILVLVICFVLPVLALAAQREDFKRLGLIAVGLEAAKYFLFLFLAGPIRNEFFDLFFGAILYVAAVPEMMIGGEFGPSSVWQWTELLCAGIVWNLAPAYLISLFLPDIPRRRVIDTPSK